MAPLTLLLYSPVYVLNWHIFISPHSLVSPWLAFFFAYWECSVYHFVHLEAALTSWWNVIKVEDKGDKGVFSSFNSC